MNFNWKRIIALAAFVCVLSSAFAQDIRGFRDDKSLYSFGEWSVYWAADNDVTLYRDDGNIALEFIAGSNGWWHLRHDGDEYVVWSSGETDEQEFFTRPWEYVNEKPLEVRDGDHFQTDEGTDGTTKYVIDGDYLWVDINDESSIDIYKYGDEIDFYNSDGDYFCYPYDISVSEDDDGGDNDYDEWGYDEWGYDEDEDYIDIGLIGRRVEIMDDGEVYATINQSDCLTWPDNETKELAGEDSWGNYSPSDGDVGTVIWTSKHCDSDDVVAIVLIDGYYVCISVNGLTTISYSRGESPYIVYW